MPARLIALIAACILVGAGAAGAIAQTTTQTMGLDECRAAAISKGLVGDARNKAINDCMGRPVVHGTTTASGSRFATCLSQGRARSLTGDALSNAVDQCMAQSGSASESAGKPTYQDCRSRAVSRGIRGDALNEFIDSCLND